MDGEGPVAVGDLLQDERTRDHPLVTASPGFRFCALQALNDRFGNQIGAVAVYDTEPREVSADLLEAIADAGEMAQRELFLSDMGGIQQKLLEKLDASRRQALLDELTRLWNRRGGMLLLERALAGAGRYQESIGVCVIDIDDFKLVNDRYGHAAGDEALREVAATIVNSIRPNDIACRLAGDEFLLVIPDTTEEQLSAITKRVSNSVQSRIIRTRAGGLRVTVSVGAAVACVSGTASADELVHRADEAMYQAKRAKDELQPRLREA
jgi:diguanylate cyclase (GGDEF)-like protein